MNKRLSQRPRSRVFPLPHFTELAALALGALASSAAAQPAPNAGAIFPMGAKRGSSIEITFYGANLADVNQVLVAGDPGVKAEIQPRPGRETGLAFSGPGLRVNDRENGFARALVTVEADAPLGEREMRVASPTGVSEPVKIIIGAYPEITENFRAGSPADAQELALPVTVNGKIGENAESDFFRVNATKGQRVIFDVNAYRLGSPLDAILILTDAKGKELARDEDTNGLDPLLDFTAPEDAAYVLELRDLRYKGSGGHVYRLTAGEIPYLDAIFPLGGSPGQSVKLKLIGRNLKGEDTLPLVIEPDAGIGPREIRAITPAGISNARSFDVNKLAETMEAEPNKTTDTATATAFPAALNGRINEPGDVDIYKLALPGGRRVAIDVFGQRFGSPIDALITLTDKTGAALAANDDAAGADSRVEYAAPADGDFFLKIADTQGRGGELFAYRVVAYEPTPDFALKYFPDNPTLSRGSRVNVRVEIDRSPGYVGGTWIEFEDLPAGVTSTRQLVPADHPGSWWMTLEASADATLGPFPLKLTGTGEYRGERVRRAAAPIIDGGGTEGDRNNPSRDRTSRQGYVVVRDAAPFTIEPITVTGHLRQGQSTQIDAFVRRKGGFKGEVRLRVDGYSYKRDAAAKNFSIEGGVAAPGENRTTLKINATPGAEPGTRPIILTGVAVIDGVERVEQSVTVPLSIYEAPFDLSLTLRRVSVAAVPEGSQSAAGEAVFAIKADRRALFTEPIALEVRGLPEGVELTAPEIKRGEAEATIGLKATSKAAPGEYQLTIVGKAEANGQKFEQTAGAVSLTIAAPEAEADKPEQEAKKPEKDHLPG